MISVRIHQDRMDLLFKIDEHADRCVDMLVNRQASGWMDLRAGRWTGLSMGGYACGRVDLRVGSAGGRVGRHISGCI